VILRKRAKLNKDLLAKMLPMLASPSDNEALSAARKIVRHLEDNSISLSEVAEDMAAAAVAGVATRRAAQDSADRWAAFHASRKASARVGGEAHDINRRLWHARRAGGVDPALATAVAPRF
jgi:hypothetical protein